MPKRKVPLEDAQPKPSLASLMPDKVKGEAARKRAVKRIVATASVKAPSTRIKQISDAFAINTVTKSKHKKKTDVDSPAGLSPQSSKAATRTKEEGSDIKREAASAIMAARKTSRSTTKKAPPKKDTAKREFAVKLPNVMSIRAREKALVLLQQAVHDFQVPAQQVAYVSGVCFVLLGSYLALSFTGFLPSALNQPAAVVQSAGSTPGMSLKIPDNLDAPVFTLIEKIPPQLSANSQYTFSLTNVKNVAVKIFSIEDGSQTEAAVDELVPGTQRYTIGAEKLKPGSYVVKASAEDKKDAARYSYELGEFSVPQPASSTVASSTAPSNATSTTLKKDNAKEATKSATSTQPLSQVHSSMRLLADAQLTGKKTIQISAPNDAKFVEIFVRPVRSIDARFLGLAEKKSDTWYYFFDTVNVPNGDYELFARTRIKDIFNESNSVNARIANIAGFTLPEVNDGSKPLESGQTIADVATPVRTFSDYSFAKASSSQSVDADVAAAADKIFVDYNAELNNVLKRYSVAVQSGNQLLINTALDELSKLQNSILLEVLNDPSKNYLADNLNQQFGDRFETIKKHIATFEELRRTAGSEDIKLDFDKDGISDFDERNLYHTNPEQADTDNDGVNDGIEIMRGFDPRSPVGEAVINYELPQNTYGLVRDDSMQIDSVQPLVNHLSDSQSVVQAEIHGTALPNSYVTLYVFSNPTITTVRTDDKGAFSYTFEKELEDGPHEVYAAVTDNAGKIVAVSAPYKFVKQASLFTPASALETAGVGNSVALSDFSRLSTSNAIIGIAILALGIILIMLAVSLRRRFQEHPEEVSV